MGDKLGGLFPNVLRCGGGFVGNGQIGRDRCRDCCLVDGFEVHDAAHRALDEDAFTLKWVPRDTVWLVKEVRYHRAIFTEDLL